MARFFYSPHIVFGMVTVDEGEGEGEGEGGGGGEYEDEGKAEDDDDGEVDENSYALSGRTAKAWRAEHSRSPSGLRLDHQHRRTPSASDPLSRSCWKMMGMLHRFHRHLFTKGRRERGYVCSV